MDKDKILPGTTRYPSVDLIVEDQCSPEFQAYWNLHKEHMKSLDLLEEIRGWMCDNDYECGDHGSQIFEEIVDILKANGRLNDE